VGSGKWFWFNYSLLTTAYFPMFIGGTMEPDVLKDIYQLVMALGIIIAVSNVMVIIKLFDVSRTLKIIFSLKKL